MELAKSNAEEFQLRNDGFNAGFDQLYFLAEGVAPQFDKLNAIANRTYRAGQIMAYAGCDKGCYIGFFCHMMASKKRVHGKFEFIFRARSARATPQSARLGHRPGAVQRKQSHHGEFSGSWKSCH